MNFFEKIVYKLSKEMTTPSLYGIFHIISLLLTIALTIFLCAGFKNCKDKTFRRIIFIGWIVMLLFELYKQIVFSFNYENGFVEWDYQWYSFPFQLCSTPLYLLPLIVFLKDGKVRDAIMSYIATFAFFGGLATMIFPDTVYIEIIGINIQTMVWHGLQVVLGIFIFVYNRKRFNHKYFLLGILVFIAMLIIAMTLNLVVVNFISETFNMFYISPYFECILVILQDVYNSVPYVLFLLTYIIGFVLIAYLMFIIMYGINRICNKKN